MKTETTVRERANVAHDWFTSGKRTNGDRFIKTDRDEPTTSPVERDANARAAALLPKMIEVIQSIHAGQSATMPDLLIVADIMRQLETDA